MATHVENVIRHIANLLKGEVHRNVAITTHTEFIEYATLPAVNLYYPNMADFRPNEVNEQRIEYHDDNTTTVRPPLIYKNLEFRIEIVADKIIGEEGLASLQTRAAIFFQKHGIINVDEEEYDLQGAMGDEPRFTPNTNIKKLMGSLVVEGVRIDSGIGRKGYVVVERTLDYTDPEGAELIESQTIPSQKGGEQDGQS